MNRTGKRTLKFSTVCSVSSCRTQLLAGSAAWWCATLARGERVRCISCGPHPDAATPTRDRRTHAEINAAANAATSIEPKRAPRPAPREEVATMIAPIAKPAPSETEVNILRARVAGLTEAVNELAAKVDILEATPRTVLEVRTPSHGTNTIDNAHMSLAEIVGLVSCGFNNLFLVGPAGSGKTTLASQLAKALGRSFGFISLSGGTSEAKLTGNLRPTKDGAWTWFCPSFVRIFRDGGVFLLDEMDAAEPNVLVSINAALANGEIECDGEIISRHADTIIVAAANTFGTGADAMYVGRNPLDAATIDRFVGAIVEVTYDKRVEETIAYEAGPRGSEFLAWLWQTREAAQNAKIRRVIGTRMVQAGAKLIRGGFSLAEVKTRCLTGWTADERRKIGE
jgi:energy-coupling factor transporter ATP-binding protein EcfA2